MLRNIGARLSRTQGFTLVELLVVVAIIALLATFAAPRLFEAANRARRAPGQADLQTISAALEQYYFDHGSYPVSGAEVVKQVLTEGYLKESTTFQNGFGQGYLYITSKHGAGYLLIDLMGVRPPNGQVKLLCSDQSVTPAQETSITVAASSSLVVDSQLDDRFINRCAVEPGLGKVAFVRH